MNEWNCDAGFAVDMFAANGSEPGWSTGSRNSTYVQDR